MTLPVQGGGFLLAGVGDNDPFIPEDLSPELQQLRTATRDFIEGEVLPRDAEIDAKTPGVLPTLMKKAGELGLMMVEIPEAYGGLALGKVAATVVCEGVAGQASFTVALLCHTGIATLPLLHYGNEAQKQKYLPKLASGEFLGAYALTEANAGSDALAGRMRATKSKDGKHYLLSGEKVFITNGGFADLFTVFAKVDGDKFSAFLVERTMAGVAQGPEEHKLGIHGSSTVSLILQDAKVPAENLLGEVGKGHKIAFNTLNVGRWKLGAGSCGSSKRILASTIKYVKERQQFGQPLANFELVQQKIADGGVRTFLAESIVYRYAGALDQLFATVDESRPDAGMAKAAMNEELAIEASICKVFCSEVLDHVADEAVQLYGGYGFIEEYRPAHDFRDARINRIFEGTNEINRFLIPGTLLKRMAKGGIDLLGHLQTILEQLRIGFPKVDPTAPMAEWQDQVNDLKRLVIYVGGVAVNKYGPEIQERQLALANLADLCIAAYVADSALARAVKLASRDPAQAEFARLCALSYLGEQLPHLKVLARQALTDIADGNEAEYIPYHKALRRFLPYRPMDLRATRAALAKKLMQETFPFA